MKQKQWQVRMAVAIVAGVLGTGVTHAADNTREKSAANEASVSNASFVFGAEVFGAYVFGKDAFGEDGDQGDHLFDSFASLGAKAKESNEVTLDKSMLGLVAGKGGDKAELAKKLDLVEIRNYEFTNEGEYNLADVLAITKRLEGDGWKHIVRNRDGKALNDIAVKQDREGVTKEMVIINADAKELNLIHVKGNVTISDMHHMGGLMGGVMQADKANNAESPKLKNH